MADVPMELPITANIPEPLHVLIMFQQIICERSGNFAPMVSRHAPSCGSTPFSSSSGPVAHNKPRLAGLYSRKLLPSCSLVAGELDAGSATGPSPARLRLGALRPFSPQRPALCGLSKLAAKRTKEWKAARSKSTSAFHMPLFSFIGTLARKGCEYKIAREPGT